MTGEVRPRRVGRTGGREEMPDRDSVGDVRPASEGEVGTTRRKTKEMPNFTFFCE